MRITIDAMRLVVLNAADTMDLQGNKAGLYAIAQSKIMCLIHCSRSLMRLCKCMVDANVWWTRSYAAHATARAMDIC